ncbi:hypothetical protein SKAU_G00187460 [Synaphobranchus kaupii]|uniref:Mediator of RNA polymerase II transcription subunit 23 n=1 Tax=Synaphobranchus kaupii TaxID=118154 RepID=A0A9Q1FD13_SYNKA|nr:hypothetical protein SKAU_G00187460 [Synaphobranchus kaupii]
MEAVRRLMLGRLLSAVHPVPDINKPQSTHAFAMTCIWIHLNRKAQNDNSKLQIPIPHSLKLHHEFLQQSLRNKSLP